MDTHSITVKIQKLNMNLMQHLSQYLRNQTPFSPHLRTCKGKTRNRRIKKEVSFKTVNFITPMEGILVLRRDHIGYILNIHVHFYFILYTLIRFTYRANLTNLV